MNTQAFIAAYRESRNGANHFVRHPLVRSFIYSDGVQQCAEAGGYWLLDILATELPQQFKLHPDGYLCIVKVTVRDQSATIVGEFQDGDPDPYRRKVDYTDLPEGEWMFYLSDDGDGSITCILPKEW